MEPTIPKSCDHTSTQKPLHSSEGKQVLATYNETNASISKHKEIACIADTSCHKVSRQQHCKAKQQKREPFTGGGPGAHLRERQREKSLRPSLNQTMCLAL